MDTNAPCALPWIDTAVARYLASPPPAPPSNYVGDQAKFNMCCTDTDNCTLIRPGSPDLTFCNLGSLLCTLGTYSYVCRFATSNPGPIGPAHSPSPSNITFTLPSAGTGNNVCYQEGKLAQRRTNIPCCKNELSNFLGSSAECLDANGAVSLHSNICCQGGSCQFRTFCATNTNSYTCQGGDKTAICLGWPAEGSSDYCVLETGLGALNKKPSCLPVQPVVVSGDDSGMCFYKGKDLGTTPTGPGAPTTTSSGRVLSPKTMYMAALLVTPLLQHLLFH
ncbi:hypothetical protein BG006_005115 [Podila minutissima]|uniref:Uncharacterized protein n=1 Tax=Podila minutissima TaxID=64525 RepID=A0A9P5SNE4_9FUNG|nr:hypothetical protein BG006_005115 [Podila minutissima]